MKRIEIMANNSVQDELLDALEKSAPGFYYTMLPVVLGRGRQRYRLGDDTWPEENFLLIIYVEDAVLDAMREGIRAFKARFPHEGIKMFVVASE